MITRQKFHELFGEYPEDVLGEDWENDVEEYMQEQEDEIYGMKFGRE